jgi:hypothetical protein
MIGGGSIWDRYCLNFRAKRIWRGNPAAQGLGASCGGRGNTCSVWDVKCEWIFGDMGNAQESQMIETVLLKTIQ